jgi:hypothetical protein
VAELKNDIQNTYQPMVTTSICGEEGPEIFHRHIRLVSREELIASIPPKLVVDDLVSAFFVPHDQIPSELQSKCLLLTLKTC